MPVVEALRFCDFESFREQLQGWDTDPVQLDAGPLDLRWTELRLEDAVLSRLSVNRAVADRSVIEAGRLGMVVAFGHQQWCGVEVAPGSLIVAAPGREYRSRLRAGFRSLELSFSQQGLVEAGFVQAALLRSGGPPEGCVIPLSSTLVAGFEAVALQLGVWAGGRVADGAACSLHQRALELVDRALGRSAVSGQRRTPRYDLALAGMRLYDSCAGDRISVSDVASALCVTPRALEYAFQSALGVSPARYALLRRLGRVRSSLSRSPAASVTTEASRHGFEHMGRFAGQYRRFFGELPSQTRGSVMT